MFLAEPFGKQAFDDCLLAVGGGVALVAGDEQVAVGQGNDVFDAEGRKHRTAVVEGRIDGRRRGRDVHAERRRRRGGGKAAGVRGPDWR